MTKCLLIDFYLLSSLKSLNLSEVIGDLGRGLLDPLSDPPLLFTGGQAFSHRPFCIVLRNSQNSTCNCNKSIFQNT